jgi:hypothetical protein
MGIEKKIVASVSPDNSDVQYQFMLEQRVLRRLCVQKIVVPTPMKDKLDKVIILYCFSPLLFEYSELHLLQPCFVFRR